MKRANLTIKFYKLLLIASALVNSSMAASAVLLTHQPITLLNNYFSNTINLQEQQRNTDFNQVTHIRLDETYKGYPVWNAQVIAHLPASANGTLTGILYQGLDKDLANVPISTVSDAQKDQSLAIFKQSYTEKNYLQTAVQDESVSIIIYVDDNNLAHYAFLVSFYFDDGQTGPHRPIAIMDAETFNIYQQWDDVKTINDEPATPLFLPANGGHVGGNEKIGKVFYDSQNLPNHFSALKIERQSFEHRDEGLCVLKNEDIIIFDMPYGEIANYKCNAYNLLTPEVYWPAPGDDDQEGSDAINGGYSPNADAMHFATITKDMYEEWYNVRLLNPKTRKAVPLIMRTHYGRHDDEAFWDSATMTMTYGDGWKMFYPLTSSDVTAHELSHGITAQYSNLNYSNEAGCMNESFSDMATQAVQLFATDKNNWEVGWDVTKGKGAMRYMKDPTKDGTSIDNANDFTNGMNPHICSGIFNKSFYLLGTSANWDTKKAFDVMLKANQDYWTPGANFQQLACGVVYASQDYHYDVTAVKAAFKQVGIPIMNISSC